MAGAICARDPLDESAMTSAIPGTRSKLLAIVSIGIFLYALAWLALLAFVDHVFGLDIAGYLLLLISAIPLFVALRLRYRRSAVRGRDSLSCSC